MATAKMAQGQGMFLVLLILTVSIIIVITGSFSWIFPTQRYDVPTPYKKISRGFLVDTTVCRIPDIHPFDRSVMKIFHLNTGFECSGNKSITYEDGNHMLRINMTAVKSYFGSQSIFCQYQEFVRSPSSPDTNFIFIGNATTFQDDIFLTNVEFIKVECFKVSNSQSIYKNFHSFIVQRDHVEKRCGERLKMHDTLHKPIEKLNVLLIALDSVSRLNFMRHMPLTRRYLLEELNAIELKGYTKVGDNTFPNVFAITTGHLLEDIHWNDTHRRYYFDKYNFIWNNFSNSGYRTMYAEDAAFMNTFNYLKKGFKFPPTDHYYRVFAVALDKEKIPWNNGNHCFGDRKELEIVLNYTFKFVSTYRAKPHFAFSFVSRLTHDQINNVGAADAPYLKFLTEMKSRGFLSNTVMLFFSDHGLRFGSILDTYSGKLELRLPMSFLVVPKWFGKKYPHLMHNLNINSERLTSPLDIYETLSDIVNFNGKIPTYGADQRGRSLFSEVPSNRTCAEAGILDNWCACVQRKPIPTNSTGAKTAALAIVQYINHNLSPYRDKCAVLRVYKIIDAMKMEPNNDLAFTEVAQLFTVTVETNPGGGRFEGTVKYSQGTKGYVVSGDLSRINLYGDQSKCFKIAKLEKYCFCK